MVLGTILYVGGFELPDKDAAAHRVYSNAKILKDLGYKVVFLDIDRDNTVYKGLKFRDNNMFEIWSQKFPNAPFSWIKYLSSITNIEKIIDEHENVKAIICYNYQSIPLWKILKYSKKNNIKVIADCTEWHEDRRFIKKIDTEFRMRYLHKKMDGVICISQYLSNYYFNHTNTIVIPPLVDKNDSKWNLIKDDYCADSHIIKFIYSGRPGRHKDKLNHIVEAMYDFIKNDNIKFTIVGITKHEYIEYYPEHSTIVNQMNDILDFRGRISHDESISLVKSADYQIFIRENKRVNNAGFPTKFVESMSCGTPVITTNTSDLEKYLMEGKNGYFVDYTNSAMLKELIQYLSVVDKFKINEMKENCKNISGFDFRSFVVPMRFFLDNVIE